MDPITASLITGILSAGAGIYGQERTNKQNIGLSREQMRFQERMSSTAAQRSVEDYRKAGLNPALAYDRSASSPTGTSTTIGDSIGAGVANAKSSLALRQQMDIARKTADADIKLKKAQEYQAVRAGDLSHQSSLSTQRDRDFQLMLQPFHFNQAAAQAMLTDAGLSKTNLETAMLRFQQAGAKNISNFEQKMGLISPLITTGKNITQILSALRGR